MEGGKVVAKSKREKIGCRARDNAGRVGREVSSEEVKSLVCSFCKRHKDLVRALISKDDVSICDACIVICIETMAVAVAKAGK